MNIALRILVILTLALNGVSLWFAAELYAKRNLLVDRNMTLEDAIVKLANTFEKEDVPHTNTADSHTARDISPVTLQNADLNPDVSDFWDGYQEQLEKIDIERYSIADRKDDLAEIYVLDKENKPLRAPNGMPITEGAPMATLLKEIQQKAMEQSNRINTVRAELKKVREELETTIEDLNATKKAARADKKVIKAREDTIAELEAKVAELEDKIATLESNVATLEEEKATLQSELDAANEDKEVLQGEVDRLRETVKQMMITGTQGKDSDPNAAATNLTAGVKGEVALADNTLNFAVIRVTEQTMDELLGPERDRKLPLTTFSIRSLSDDGKGAIVGKVRIRTLSGKKNFIVCDLLDEWKQGTIKSGDEVILLD